MIRRLNKSHDLEFHHIIRTGIPFPRRFPLTIHHLDLRYDEINRIVSKRHRIYIYIYPLTGFLSLLSLFPSFSSSIRKDLSRKVCTEIMLHIRNEGQHDITAFPDYSLGRHLLCNRVMQFVWKMRRRCIRNCLIDWVNWVIYKILQETLEF